VLTDAECSKKDFIKFATEYASISEDEAGKIWGSASYWANPYDVYTIEDDEAYFDHCSKRKCDSLVGSFSPCSYHVQERRYKREQWSALPLVTYGTHGFLQIQCFFYKGYHFQYMPPDYINYRYINYRLFSILID